MKNRIAMWAAAGFIVAGCWALYVLATSPFTNERMQGLWLLAGITCPITLASHHPIGLWTVLIANAATYALVGLIVETYANIARTQEIITSDRKLLKLKAQRS